jgi:hypothetical protein
VLILCVVASGFLSALCYFTGAIFPSIVLLVSFSIYIGQFLDSSDLPTR